MELCLWSSSLIVDDVGQDRTIFRFYGELVASAKFNENAVVILNDKLEPFGTRVIGPVLKEIQKYFRLLANHS